jgi:hypothetical protein
LIIVPTYKKSNKTGRHYTFAKYIQNFIPHPAVKVNSVCRGNYWGSSLWILTQQVNYTDHIFWIHQILEKKWNYNELVHQLFTDFKKVWSCVIFLLTQVSP